MLTRSLRTLALGALLATAAIPALADAYANPDLLISAEAMAERAPLRDTSLVVLDVRPADAFAAGHIPGAVQIDPNAVVDPASPVAGALRPLAELAEMLGGLGIAADREIVLYDDKGGFHASRLFWLLEYMGHRNVRLLDGGVQAWTAIGGALATGEGEPAEAATFRPALSPRRHASADWIMERRDDARTVVVDVRPPALYAEGHIPWALSMPWKQNLQADGTFKPADALRAHFEAMGVTPDDAIVVHCQNGLASSHSYVALRLLGYPEVRTYHRSWSEWGAADDLPKASLAEG